MSAAHWIANLAAWSAQTAALVMAGSLAAWAFRLRAPRVKLAYWQVLLILCLLLPAVEPWRRAADSDIEIATTVATPARSHVAPPISLPWRDGLLIVLASGCVVRALWLAVGFGKLHRWRRDTPVYSPLPAGLDRQRAALAPQTEFRLSAAVGSPVTFGLTRPLVVLPGGFAELPEDIQEAIVCHELLHVRRRDWVVTVAEQAVRAVLWFHPAVWWLTGQTQLAREQTVDGDVVAITGNREQYLNALLAMAGNRPALDLAPAALFLRRRHLKNRVAMLLKEVRMSKRTLISFCATSAAVLFAAGWLALHTFPLQAAPVPQEGGQSNLLHSVAPNYPQAAREKHIEGAVVLEVHIDAAGRVSDAKVLSGAEELRSAALAAILQWHYNPQAMTLPTATQVTMNFKLPNGAADSKLPFALPPDFHGTLKSIQIEGLTAAARDELLSRLPAHEGDAVNADAMASLEKAVRDFDEHLKVALSPDEPHTLRIFLAPASGPGAMKIRVGGNVQQAKLVTKVSPIYPAEAKAQGLEGLVRLEAILGKDGAVEHLEVLSGDPILAAAAIDAVRQWHYQTTLLNGDPVEVVTEVMVNFTLAK
ncbi:MAG: TonB family protein [Bryobacteraceae bacterium]